MSKVRILRLKELIGCFKETLETNESYAKLLDIEPLDKRTVDGIQKSIKNLEEAIQVIKDDTYSKFVKTGNVIVYNTGDGISYTDRNFIKILEEIPDWRDYIKVEELVVGCSDFGKWIKYENAKYYAQNEIADIISTYQCKLVDDSEMQKYVEFSETIPYGD